MKQTFALLTLTALIASCGGGGGDSQPVPPTTTTAQVAAPTSQSTAPAPSTDVQVAPVVQTPPAVTTASAPSSTAVLAAPPKPLIIPFTVTASNTIPPAANTAPTIATTPVTPADPTPVPASITPDLGAPHVSVPPSAPAPKTDLAIPPVIKPIRNTIDQPDDLTGSQIHVIYAIPADGTDNKLDLTDKFPNSLETVDAWLFQQTGQHDRMKLDRLNGKIDITFVKLPLTEAAYESFGWDKSIQIEADLRSLKDEQSGKIYLVYYDGPNPRTCADAGSLQNGHQTAVMYIHGFANSPGITPCDQNPVAKSPTDQPTYIDYVTLHELIHVMGGAHVTDSDYDLMYGGATRWDQPTKIILDYNQDSYAFDRSKGNYARGQFNLYDSPFVTKQ